MTLHQRHQLQQRARGNEARAIAPAVILFAKDKTGAKMFADDAETLAAMETQVDPAVLRSAIADAEIGGYGKVSDFEITDLPVELPGWAGGLKPFGIERVRRGLFGGLIPDILAPASGGAATGLGDNRFQLLPDMTSSSPLSDFLGGVRSWFSGGEQTSAAAPSMSTPFNPPRGSSGYAPSSAQQARDFSGLMDFARRFV